MHCFCFHQRRRFRFCPTGICVSNHPHHQALIATSEVSYRDPILFSTKSKIIMASTTDVELGEESPLLDSGEKPLEDLTGTSKTERAVAGISAISFGSSLAAMLFESNPVVYISGLIGVVVSPYAAIQQQKITQVNALAQTNERMKEEVDQLKGENIKLNAQVADLGKSVDNLKITKDKLDTIQSVQGLSLDELERQLEESKQILGKMKQNLQGDVLSNLIEVAMACDEDGDFTLDDNEIDVIIHKLEKIHDVDVDNDKVRKMIVDSGRQLEGVLEVVKNLLRSDGPESENVFHIKHKA